MRGGKQKCEFGNGLQTARKKTIEAAKEEMESAVQEVQGSFSRYVGKKTEKRKERKMNVKKRKNTKGTRLTLVSGLGMPYLRRDLNCDSQVRGF